MRLLTTVPRMFYKHRLTHTLLFLTISFVRFRIITPDNVRKKDPTIKTFSYRPIIFYDNGTLLTLYVFFSKEAIFFYTFTITLCISTTYHVKPLPQPTITCLQPSTSFCVPINTRITTTHTLSITKY